MHRPLITLVLLCDVSLAFGQSPAAIGLRAPDAAFGTYSQTERAGLKLSDALTEMARVIEPCVQPTTGLAVFTHCVDWHSSVHAHWAAYRIARFEPSQNQIAETSYLALEVPKLLYEQQNIPPGEMPYGRAWFLRLAIEYEKWALESGKPDAGRLRFVANSLSLQLYDYYTTNLTPTPLVREYGNASWALAQLFDYARFIGAESMAAAVKRMVQAEFLAPYPELTWNKDKWHTGFFSRFGNWVYLLSKTLDDKSFNRFLLDHPILQGGLAVPALTTAHSHGLLWSRVWAFQAIANRTPSATLRRRYRKAAFKHALKGLERHENAVGNFLAYDHWVPQFAVYALTPEFN